MVPPPEDVMAAAISPKESPCISYGSMVRLAEAGVRLFRLNRKNTKTAMAAKAATAPTAAPAMAPPDTSVDLLAPSKVGGEDEDEDEGDDDDDWAGDEPSLQLGLAWSPTTARSTFVEGLACQRVKVPASWSTMR